MWREIGQEKSCRHESEGGELRGDIDKLHRLKFDKMREVNLSPHQW
jgi:hypothetical protein